MDSLLGYGSDASGGEEEEEVQEAPKPQKGGLLGSLPAARSGEGLGGLPPPKKQRRTLDIGKMVKKPTKGSDSEEEEAAPVVKPKGSSGLLSFLPAPKNDVSTTAYEEAEARKEARKGPGEEGSKKMSKAQMAAALFEKQKQDRARERASTDDVEPGGGGHAGGGSEEAPQRQVVDPNWAAAWDDTHQAYYYYHTISGETQWEPPFGFDTTSLQQQQQSALPEDLARELAKEQRRAGARGEFIPDAQILSQTKSVVGEKLLHEGEKHKQYTSAVAAFHTPMASVKGKPTQIERRKHQITDVLAMAAANELEYLDKAASGKRTSAQVRGRYGW